MSDTTAVQTEQQTTEAVELTDDDWGGVDLSDVVEEQVEATPATEEGGKPADTTVTEKPTEAPASEADQSFTLNYMGENKVVTRDEAVALAQKGMDYDRQRVRAEETAAEKAKLEKTLSYVSEIAKNQGMTVDELLENIQATSLSQKEGITPAAALDRVKLEKRERDLAEREAALGKQKEADGAQKAEADRRQADIKNFLDAYPEVDPKTIPPEVWAGVAKGASLTEAYARHEAAQLKIALAAERKNHENETRSAGSKATEGQREKVDPIDEAWNAE